jgi:transposase-like protein
MGLSRRQFTQEFKLAAVRRLEQGVSIAEVARGLEVNPNVLHRWRREFRQGPGNAFPGKRKAALVRRPGCGTGAEGGPAGAGDRFFEGVLAAHRGAADVAGTDWESAVFRKVKEEVNAGGGLTIERMVKLARVSRASYYRFDENAESGYPSEQPQS